MGTMQWLNACRPQVAPNCTPDDEIAILVWELNHDGGSGKGGKFVGKGMDGCAIPFHGAREGDGPLRLISTSLET